MGRTTQINLLVDKPYQKRAVKCYLAFWPEDDVNHLRLVYTTDMQRESLVSIRVRAADAA